MVLGVVTNFNYADMREWKYALNTYDCSVIINCTTYIL